MLEISCKSGVAVTAERVQAVLAADGHRWLVNANAPGVEFADVPIMVKLSDLFIYAANIIQIPEAATVVDIGVMRDRLTGLGSLVIERRGSGCVMRAENYARTRVESSPLGTNKITVTEEISNDLQAITPVWERIVAELRRLGLVIGTTRDDGGRAADRGVSGHLPLRANTREKWRLSYLVMAAARRKRLADYDDTPTWSGYSDLVFDKYGWRLREQVLRWIMQEGEAGKLKKPM